MYSYWEGLAFLVDIMSKIIEMVQIIKIEIKNVFL
jgi:hypothetical protein